MTGLSKTGRAMQVPAVLVVAKAPVPGLAKTRVAKTVGDHVAAELAATALLDTLEAVGSVGWPVVVALTGDLGDAARGEQIRIVLAPFRVIEQRGNGLAERLAWAHADADGGFGIVQIGMDTPQLAAVDLLAAGVALDNHDAAVGPAEDGGWWLLALRSAVHAKVLTTVPMSHPDTCRHTVAALIEAGAEVAVFGPLADVDTWQDGLDLAAGHPHLRAPEVVCQFAQQKAVSIWQSRRSGISARGISARDISARDISVLCTQWTRLLPTPPVTSLPPMARYACSMSISGGQRPMATTCAFSSTSAAAPRSTSVADRAGLPQH